MPALHRAFGPGVTVDLVPGIHGQLFTPDLAQTVARVLASADPAPPATLWRDVSTSG